MSVPFEQEFELYHCGESLCSQKARIGMAEKDVAYKSRHIMLCDIGEACENLTPEYLAVNPKGIVPTLVHNGEPVYDAHRMVRYVDELHPSRGEKLWPEDPKLRAEAEFWFSAGMLKDKEPLSTSFGNAIPVFTLPILASTLGRQPMESVEKNFARHPNQERAQLFIGLRKNGPQPPPGFFEAAAKELCGGLLRLEKTIAQSGGPWALGDFSLVDVTMMACFHRLEDVRLDVILKEKTLPNLWSYWERLQSRPTYKTCVTDWHDAAAWRPAIEEVFRGNPSPLQPLVTDTLASLA